MLFFAGPIFYTTSTMSPIKAIVMIITCLAVAGAMTAIMKMFFKKLNAIEEERWGAGARWGAAVRHKGTQNRKDI